MCPRQKNMEHLNGGAERALYWTATTKIKNDLKEYRALNIYATLQIISAMLHTPAYNSLIF